MMIKFTREMGYSILRLCMQEAILSKLDLGYAKVRDFGEFIRMYASASLEGSAVMIVLSQASRLVVLEGEEDPKEILVDRNFDRLLKELVRREVRLPLCDDGDNTGLLDQNEIVSKIYDEKGWTRKFEVVKISRFMKKIWTFLGATNESDFQSFIAEEVEPLIPVSLGSFSIVYGTNDAEIKGIIDKSAVRSCMKHTEGGEDLRDFSHLAASGCRYVGLVRDGKIIVRGQTRWCEEKGVWMIPAIYSSIPESLALRALKHFGIVPVEVGVHVSFDFSKAVGSGHIYDDFYGWLNSADTAKHADQGMKAFTVWKRFEAKVYAQTHESLYKQEKGCNAMKRGSRFFGRTLFQMWRMGIEIPILMELHYSSVYDQDYDQWVVSRDTLFMIPTKTFEGSRVVDQSLQRIIKDMQELADFLDEGNVDLVSNEWEPDQGFCWRSRDDR